MKETIKLLKENTDSKLFDIDLSSVFYSVSLGKGCRSKHKQTGLKQTKRVLHSKESKITNTKTTNKSTTY